LPAQLARGGRRENARHVVIADRDQRARVFGHLESMLLAARVAAEDFGTESLNHG
jgi:hypothetical protein